MPVTATWTNPGAGGALDFSAGQVLTDTHMDSITSNFLFLGGTTGTWVTWTPTMTQGAGLTITVNRASYLITHNKTAIVQVDISISSAGTGGSVVLLASVPAAIAPTQNGISGFGYYRDASTSTYYSIVLAPASGTTFGMIAHLGTNSFGSNPAVTAASGDSFVATLVYQMA